MKMTDLIADMILDMFDDNQQTIQIQRNDLASRIGCVPSQINYVITSRFTPEQGYRIESRRGGGGCIYITRADTKGSAFVSLINSIGNEIDERTDANFRGVAPEVKNQVRASLLKRMLLAYID